VTDLHEQIASITGESGWDISTLAAWLDRSVRHPDIPQSQSSVFIHRAVAALIEGRGVAVEQLARIKFRLRDAMEKKIGLHRDTRRKRAFQSFLFGSAAGAVEVDPASCFTFDPERYAPNWYYEGSYRFKRHCLPYVGELKPKGEEFECAVFLDEMEETWHWLRNLPRRPTSFWLPTSTDRFYPDFVCLLRDGRILVVEYKGGYIATAEDAKEKKAIGEIWAAKSGGRCLFAMPTRRDWQAITECVTKPGV
jgi:type III restriction enzyme